MPQLRHGVAFLQLRRGIRRLGGVRIRSSSLGAEGETVEVQGTKAAGSASSSDPEPLAGHSPLPSAPLSGGPWVPSATLLPATPSRHRGRPSVASRQRDRPAALNAATAGVRRLARAQSDHRGVQSLSRRQPLIGTGTGGLRGTPEHRPTPALQLSAASSPCLARPALSHRGSARRRCPPPLRGAGCRGTAGDQTGSGGKHVVGIAVRAGRPAAVNWKRTSHHQGGNKLSGQAHTSGEVTENVTGYRVSR